MESFRKLLDARYPSLSCYRSHQKKKTDCMGVPHSVGFAICSPRGLGDPHDIAPRGS